MKKILFIIFFIILSSINALAQVDFANRHDSKTRIEITADTLEVTQDKREAVFTGSVEAKQGELNLRADKMFVYYSMEKDKSGETQHSVSKVETNGNVFLSTPKETAYGNRGVFDVDKNIITLSGKVVITSGKNIVKGEKMLYNLNTGKSSLVSDKKDNIKKKERVRGVFVPNG